MIQTARLILMFGSLFLAGSSFASAQGWDGKTCAILGDSIVWYDGNNAMTDSQERIIGYPYYIRELGFETVDNYGHNGASLAFHEDSAFRDILTVAENDVPFESYDLVIIAGGVNDYLFTESPIEATKEDPLDPTTVCGALRLIEETIRSNHEDVKIVFFTPLPCINCERQNSLGFTLSDYVNAICSVGVELGIPVLDLYQSEALSYDKLNELTLDGLHPNNEGFRVICTETVLPFLAMLGKDDTQAE